MYVYVYMCVYLYVCVCMYVYVRMHVLHMILTINTTYFPKWLTI
jgi:hypothetical protein